jgi:hypothetical protein
VEDGGKGEEDCAGEREVMRGGWREEVVDNGFKS